MFTIEIKINGSMIGHIYGRNIGYTEDCGPNEHMMNYTYEYYEPETREIKSGRVKHERTDGARRLVQLILEDLDDEN